jgi:putative ABC transport system ATP-binding protein
LRRFAAAAMTPKKSRRMISIDAKPDGAAVEVRGARLTLEGGGGPVAVLRGVDLRLHRGEKIALVGPSGSGKTSLLAVIAGLQKLSGGAVRALGRDLGGMSEDELADYRRRNVGIVFQHYHLIPTMTALENAAMPLELAGDGDAEEKAAEALAKVGLAARAAHYPRELSGGEQQRVAVARAFANAPPLLLADEPTGNLDSENGAQTLDAMMALAAAADSAALVITHDEAALSRFDRVLKMRDGAISE